jgi:SAM-dependent methyltransferase
MINFFEIPDKTVKIQKSLRSRGLVGTLAATYRFIFPPKVKTLPVCQDLVAGRRGLEIGGPTKGFGREGTIPIYPIIAGLDNCNFGSQTVWEGQISGGISFQYDANKPKGHQYIAEATELPMFPADTYEFVLSCHSLEHTTNPLRALKEWIRVTKDNGGLLLVLPHKEGTCDHRRPVTKLSHLIEDFQKDTAEDDLTHLPEVLELHDLDRDWGTGDFAALRQRSLKNFENRCMHHHVFNTPLAVEMVDAAGMQIISVEAVRPFHIIVVARKMVAGMPPQNEVFLSPTAEWRRTSPFRTDR